MRNILRKEVRLSSSVLSFLFILFGLMFLIPGYPILCSVFFVSLGIFQSFQTAREANDIVFSALLPIAKKDVVKGKFLFVCLIEACALLLMTLAVILRMTVFSAAPVYRSNALMNANFFALAVALLIFGLFNLIFVGNGEDLGAYGFDAKVIELPGHTLGSIGVDVEEKHLLVGDALDNWIRPGVGHLFYDRDALERSAEKIRALGDRTIYYGHGKPTQNGMF